MGLRPFWGLGDQKAWDVYLLDDENAEWTDSPPKPIFWHEQLRISDETQPGDPKLTA